MHAGVACEPASECSGKTSKLCRQLFCLQHLAHVLMDECASERGIPTGSTAEAAAAQRQQHSGASPARAPRPLQRRLGIFEEGVLVVVHILLVPAFD